MTTLMDRLGESWTTIVDEYADPRVKDWPLMQTPWPTLTIVVAYVLFVKRVGPQMMKHRKPYELRGPIIAYNLFQVILSTLIFYKAARNGWLTTYNWRCEPLNRSNTGSPMQVISSLLEPFDSFVFHVPFTCRLSLQCPWSWFLAFLSSHSADMLHFVCLLSEQVHRAAWHRVFHSAQKVQSSFNFARHSSWHYAFQWWDIEEEERNIVSIIRECEWRWWKWKITHWNLLSSLLLFIALQIIIKNSHLHHMQSGSASSFRQVSDQLPLRWFFALCCLGFFVWILLISWIQLKADMRASSASSTRACTLSCTCTIC